MDFLIPLIVQNFGAFDTKVFRVFKVFRAVKALKALRVLRTIRLDMCTHIEWIHVHTLVKQQGIHLLKVTVYPIAVPSMSCCTC